MRRGPSLRRRILAIDPTHRGFGYVVFEEPHRLVDWGLCQVRRSRTNQIRSRVRNLARLVAPDLIVLEDTAQPGCRRGHRARHFIHGAAIEAAALQIRIRYIPAALVRERHDRVGGATKDIVARRMIVGFPELATLLPATRKPWMSEPEAMAVFDACGFALHAISPRRAADRENGNSSPEGLASVASS